MIHWKVALLCTWVVASSARQIVQRSEEGQEREHYHRSSNLRLKPVKQAFTEAELESKYWNDAAQESLGAKLKMEEVSKVAKNIIFFIGDGMSSQTVAATRMYLGNENEQLSFEKFPYLGQAKTYCVNRQVADSACTGTAYLSGVKINYGMLNIAASVPRYDCDYEKTNETEIFGIMKWAQDAGKATGIVTNTRITHASPAASYAQSATRGWEYDVEVRGAGCDQEKTMDIAQQLVRNEVSKNFKVAMGGGRRYFLPRDVNDGEGARGYREDGKNLVEEWLETHKAMGESEFVWNREQLLAVDPKKTDYLLGLFEASHMKFNLVVEEQNAQDMEPTLAEMVEAAVKVLQESEEGFVLFVEGGLIDLAHHDTTARLALDETAEYSKAIEHARKLTSEDDTLIVVSSDHSHTMTYNGYPTRGNDILGIGDVSDWDRLPYTTLSYANGPGYGVTYNVANVAERLDISGYDFTRYNQRYLATVPLGSETHGGEDVNVYASGPFAHLFVGNYEQSALPHLMAYAGNFGEFYREIEEDKDKEDDDDDAGSSLVVSVPVVLIAVIVGLLMRP
ncbi:alkaline phosphatase-like [Culex pipiens pallens]|uniref:alkaline phosphatase-like n=1 Tax=Culex pipiens pallens TaxID=42434 RepID=UPI001953BF80|nr:alkaline phosphatase-like [Culex pipiens pallens]